MNSILGSQSRERVLTFIAARGEGYAREITEFWGCADRPIKRELNILESSGVLTARTVGRTVVYTINPRFFLRKELVALVLKMVDGYPPQWKEALLLNRRRPRAKGKPVRLLANIERGTPGDGSE